MKQYFVVQSDFSLITKCVLRLVADLNFSLHFGHENFCWKFMFIGDDGIKCDVDDNFFAFINGDSCEEIGLGGPAVD
jgi:hypothetical protein